MKLLNKARNSPRSAFTVVEVMVSMLILAMGAYSLYKILPTMPQAIGESQLTSSMYALEMALQQAVRSPETYQDDIETQSSQDIPQKMLNDQLLNFDLN